ncbi:MAG: RNA-binding cell elongation regulator Jag/EloR [Christensenellaceae bacterium]
MEYVEAKGKTVDEAIFNGLNEMGLALDEVDIEIIQEGSKGIFGLGKNALVRLSKKGEAESSVAADIQPEFFLNELFAKMKIDVSCQLGEEENGIKKIDIYGKDTAVVIGRRGDTLDALQYLTGLVINRGREDYTKVMLDAENYRQKREQTLEKLAKRLANTVSKTGKPITLEPMNPYERRILHATLQNNPRVVTYSEGEEPYRRVVVRRKRGNE